MQYENLCIFKSFATLGSSDGYFRKEVLSVHCTPGSSSRCSNTQTVAPPNNHVFRVPCHPPLLRVQGRTYHADYLKSKWGWLGDYFVLTRFSIHHSFLTARFFSFFRNKILHNQNFSAAIYSKSIDFTASEQSSINLSCA